MVGGAEDVSLLDAGFPVGITGCFTTRSGGASASPWDSLNLALHVGDDPVDVRANRSNVAGRIGVDRIAFPEQVHGAEVAQLVDAGSVELSRWPGGVGCDAIVTAERGVALGVLVADCMPVLLADPGAGVVGAAHAGRRGLAAGVLRTTLDAMSGLGAEAARIVAVVGPSICGRCYEVPERMRAEIDAAVPGTACETSAGTPGLDLVAGAISVLRAAGVTATATRICTAEDARFYSYRRDGRTGRFAGIVMLSGDG